MSLIGIYFVLLYFGGSLQNGVCSTDWVDDLTKCIVEDSEFYQVKLMTRMADDEILMTNRPIEELSVKLMQNLATVRINYEHDFKLTADFGNDSSATLFVLAIESSGSGSLPIQMTIKLIDALVETTRYHEGSKYLVVSFARDVDRDGLRELLEHAWKKKLLEFTVIELLETRDSSRCSSSIEIERPSGAPAPIIHRLDPFQAKYTRTNGSLNKKNLFPDKLRVTEMSCNLTVSGDLDVPNDGIIPLSLLPSKYQILDALFDKLNCALSLVSFSEDANSIYSEIEKHNVDLSAQLYPYLFRGSYDEQRSVVVKMDRLCPLVPVKFKYAEYLPLRELIEAYALSLAVVGFFFIFMRLLRFNSYTWRIFNIGRLFFGISVSLGQPRIAVERIIFACLLLISATYSSLVYGTIADMTFGKIVEIEYKTLEELDDSGLTPYIAESDFAKASHIFDDRLKTLRSKLVIETGIYKCINSALLEREVVCFTNGAMAMFFSTSKKLKFAKICLSDEYLSFIVGKRSPYRSRINEIIVRLQSSGIASKSWSWEETSRRGYEPDAHLETTSHLTRLIAISLAGYSLAILVFLGEVIYHRLSLMYIANRGGDRRSPNFFKYFIMRIINKIY